MKKRWSTILLTALLLLGLSVLLYPAFAQWWNGRHQSRVIDSYARAVAQIDEAQYDALWSAARAYNRSLTQRHNGYALTDTQRREYEALLDIDGSGMMGYVEIPSINCSLPIYHGADESVLQTAVGHLEWTSLPVGGESSHCVLSGHCGLPGARLFTDLEKLEEGDFFTLRVLDEVLTYEVDQILVVLPDQTDALCIQPGQDYCTLVTCTPYGINSHRLLVRGHRVANREEEPAPPAAADAGFPLWPVWVVSAAAAICLGILLCRRRRKTGGKSCENR